MRGAGSNPRPYRDRSFHSLLCLSLIVEEEESNVLPIGLRVLVAAAFSGSDHPGRVEQFGWP